MHRNPRLWAWLCLFTIVLLFDLPAALCSTVVELSAVRLSLEVPLLLTLWLTVQGSPHRFWPAALRVLSVSLVAYRVDQWVCWTLLRDEPLLYDQWFMLRHLWALIGDLMSATTALVLVAGALGSVLLFFLVRALLRRARALAVPDRRRQTAALGALVWCLLLVFRASQLSSEDPGIAWLTPKIVRNVQRSRRAYVSVQKRLRKSPYVAYAGLKLSDRPDVLLFIVESYGRLLWVEQGTRARHAALLSELETQLTNAGFYAASAFATATVSGGRSWIAEGTIMMGTPIRYEAVFQHIVAQKPKSFVGFLNDNGYHSVLLAPADRDRAGFHPENRYGFAQLITYDQLAYKGPPVGWGRIPDQFSLAYVEHNLLRDAQKPVFLDFHMVTSHAPWSEVPRLSADPAQLLSAAPETPANDAPGSEAVSTSFRRYARGSGRFAYMRHFDDAMRKGYQATIEYDLRAITQYLSRRDKDAFVIVLGDHQPPVIAREDKSFDAPVHVLSRDPTRLAPLLAHGFVRGLSVPADAAPAVGHAGLFSLWVHTLLSHGCKDCALPAVLPQGDHVLAR